MGGTVTFTEPHHDRGRGQRRGDRHPSVHPPDDARDPATVPAEQRVKIVQIDIPLDPGSDTASLEVQHLRPGRPGLGV